MNDPVVVLLFLATWGGIVLVFRRLTDDFRKATVRQSTQSPLPAVDEELLRLTGEVQETVEGLSDALTKRAEQLRTLIAEADSRIEALRGAARPATPATSLPPAVEAPLPAVVAPSAVPSPPAPPAAPAAGRAGAEEIRRLAAEGHDPDTIARLTNRGREEVRIVLATRS